MTVLSRVSQKVCRVEGLLSVIVIILRCVFDIFSCFIKQKHMYNVYTMPHMSVYESLDSFVDLSINWPINSFLIVILALIVCSGNAFTCGWLVYGDGCLMPRQFIVKMIGNVQNDRLMHVELLLRWLISKFNCILPGTKQTRNVP